MLGTCWEEQKSKRKQKHCYTVKNVPPAPLGGSLSSDYFLDSWSSLSFHFRGVIPYSFLNCVLKVL